jgi:hypothetical protein
LNRTAVLDIVVDLDGLLTIDESFDQHQVGKFKVLMLPGVQHLRLRMARCLGSAVLNV